MLFDDDEGAHQTTEEEVPSRDGERDWAHSLFGKDGEYFSHQTVPRQSPVPTPRFSLFALFLTSFSTSPRVRKDLKKQNRY